MATESPVRMVESTNWPSSKAVTAFSSQVHNIAGDELEVLLKTHKYRDQSNMAPNRSGSAPPSIEGSFAAYGNLMAHKSSNLKSSSMGFGNSLKTSGSEEQMRADPAYVDYYYSNVNLNPRLPPPIVSRDNNGNNWRLTSYDDSGNGSLHFARDSLSPHKEENEEDKSDNCSDSGNVLTPGYDAHHKSLVDLIQDDFPRTPSPLYSLSHSSTHAATSDELSDHNVQSISLDNLFLNASKLPNPNLGSVNACADMKTEDSKPYNPTSNEGPLDTSLLDGSNVDTTADAPQPPEDARNMYTRPGDKLVMLSDGTQPDLRISQQQISNENRQLLQQHTPFSQHQHFLQPSGVTPLYTTTKGYMTSGNLPFYPGGSHLSSGGIYAAAPPPQYGGYTMNPAFLPQYVAGYPTAGMHMQYSAAATTPGVQYFNGRAGTNFSSGDVIPHTGVDLLHQQLNKFYGGQQQQGLTPPQMQYFQQNSASQGAYGGQYGYFASTNAFDGQDNYSSFSSEKQAAFDAATYRGGVNGRGAEMIGSGSGGGYGSPSMAQFQVSPFGSPFLPGSPVAPGVNTVGRRNELRLSQGGSNRNVGIYNQWQGQRGAEIVSDPHKKHSILDELKSFGARKFDLSDIAGRIVEFSVDQHGSRFIQQKLEYCGDEEKESVFREILPHASKLMTDVFGNYVIQKFFEHGSCEQRKQLAEILRGQILPLTFQMYGCRVIQKALEVVELDQKTELVHELDGHVLRCVRDQNGNHVIQKCIESIPTEKIGFILSSFQGEVATLSTHPYGCRVIQRVLEHCGDNLQSQCIINEILESAYILAQDQYGNYVAQHVLERGKPHERSKIISKLTGRIVQMSQHKYASNVVEKCLEYGDVAERERLIEEILGISDEDNNLLTMMKDQFANYVVQKTLEISSDKQREVLLNRINLNLQALRKYTYGKHIVARFEQLCGEEAEG